MATQMSLSDTYSAYPQKVRVKGKKTGRTRTKKCTRSCQEQHLMCVGLARERQELLNSEQLNCSELWLGQIQGPKGSRSPGECRNKLFVSSMSICQVCITLSVLWSAMFNALKRWSQRLMKQLHPKNQEASNGGFLYCHCLQRKLFFTG